ncbi:hypothetical protein BU26DRAFT_525550 [Trematosphaeria pertusa]|uniref:CENP-V/GFA domain-containing protein n=1 Tax=Trematosphaeria pertusa TaxID=390896 RepID=A0A6A6HSC6_9PLEO|nr:uncharacterized protein BU26DRAFT_525550 [Trematosphaeria pertusa]KAF2241016.1 hypothetical protein BU26DRAFT_525550 [Trematosphaeria pertusa]
MAQTNRPDSISGGCLCGAIRFTVNFPNESDWPPKGVCSSPSRCRISTANSAIYEKNGVCQCTMCRKHGGSLLPQNCSFPLSHISPPLSSNPTYKTYASGPHTERGFCSTCGSALTFNDKRDDALEINLGAFDEDVLCGKRDEANAWEDEYGRHVPRTGGWGHELAFPQYHIFAENEVPGVTDGFEGVKYLMDRKDAKGFKGKARELRRA